MGLIELKDIHKTYVMGDIKLPVLKGITLSVEKGDMDALTGASGSGNEHTWLPGQADFRRVLA